MIENPVVGMRVIVDNISCGAPNKFQTAIGQQAIIRKIAKTYYTPKQSVYLTFLNPELNTDEESSEDRFIEDDYFYTCELKEIQLNKYEIEE
jgi:hypothetical protein